MGVAQPVALPPGIVVGAHVHEQGGILESSTDAAVRRAAFKKMLEIWDDNPPAVILYSNAVFFGKQKSVDWTPYGCQFMDFGPDNVKAK